MFSELIFFQLMTSTDVSYLLILTKKMGMYLNRNISNNIVCVVCKPNKHVCYIWQYL